MDEITVTGAPAIVTALGMGTVFLCLVLLYLVTQVVGRWMPRLLGSVESATAVEAVDSEERAPALPAAGQAPAAGGGAIAAAVALALARDRSWRMSSVVEAPRGAGPWKIAGRIRALRPR